MPRLAAQTRVPVGGGFQDNEVSCINAPQGANGGRNPRRVFICAGSVACATLRHKSGAKNGTSKLIKHVLNGGEED